MVPVSREEKAEQKQKEKSKKRKRYVMIGLATVGGGALLGEFIVYSSLCERVTNKIYTESNL